MFTFPHSLIFKFSNLVFPCYFLFFFLPFLLISEFLSITFRFFQSYFKDGIDFILNWSERNERHHLKTDKQTIISSMLSGFCWIFVLIFAILLIYKNSELYDIKFSIDVVEWLHCINQAQFFMTDNKSVCENNSFNKNLPVNWNLKIYMKGRFERCRIG